MTKITYVWRIIMCAYYAVMASFNLLSSNRFIFVRVLELFIPTGV